jgi:hypothetical protein
VGSGIATTRPRQKPIERGAVLTDDRRDIAEVEPLDHGRDHGRTLDEAQRAQCAGHCRLDSELGQWLEARRDAGHAPSRPHNPCSKPGGCPFRVPELIEMGDGRVECVDRELGGTRSVAEHQEQCETVEVAAMNLAKGIADHVGRSGIGGGRWSIGCEHSAPSAVKCGSVRKCTDEGKMSPLLRCGAVIDTGVK